jgi:Fe-S oxidoreductase
MDNQLKEKITDSILNIELSTKDAHWKANRKHRLYCLLEMCEQCPACSPNCPLKEKIMKCLNISLTN